MRRTFHDSSRLFVGFFEQLAQRTLKVATLRLLAAVLVGIGAAVSAAAAAAGQTGRASVAATAATAMTRGRRIGRKNRIWIGFLKAGNGDPRECT